MKRRNIVVKLFQTLLKRERAARRRDEVVPCRLPKCCTRSASPSEPAGRGRPGDGGANPACARCAPGQRLGRRAMVLGGRTRHLRQVQTTESAVLVLGDESLRDISRKLFDAVRRNVTFGWMLCENASANIPRWLSALWPSTATPSTLERVTGTILKHAEFLSGGRAA